MNLSARSSLLFACTVILALGSTGVSLAEGTSQTMESTAFRIGIKLVRSCELRTSGLTPITCTRPVPHRTSDAAQPALPQVEALTPPSPQRTAPGVPQAAGADPRFETFTF